MSDYDLREYMPPLHTPEPLHPAGYRGQNFDLTNPAARAGVIAFCEALNEQDRRAAREARRLDALPRTAAPRPTGRSAGFAGWLRRRWFTALDLVSAILIAVLVYPRLKAGMPDEPLAVAGIALVLFAVAKAVGDAVLKGGDHE